MRWLLLTAAALALACDAPGRTKPWRHAGPAGPVDAALPDGTTRIAADRAAPPADTLRIWLPAAPTSLHPLARPTREALWIVEDTVYETLLRVEPSGDGRQLEVVPGLAESWRVIGQGEEIRFQLRPGVRFHDGQPFTADDAKHSIDLARRAASSPPRLKAALDRVTSVSSWGTRDLRIYMYRPDAHALRALAEVPMLPRESESRLASRPNGTGPYRVAARTATEITLERWDAYAGGAALPAISRVVYRVIPDAAAALVAARKGDIDVIPELIPSHYPGQAEAPGVSDSFASLRLAPPWFRYLLPDTTRAPFDDPRVRQALSLLVDRERLVSDVYGGLARAIVSPVWPGGPGHGVELAPPARDLAAAQRLLDEAGWTRPAHEAPRERLGQPLTVQLLVQKMPSEDPLLGLLVGWLEEAGFRVEPRVGTQAVIENRIARGGFGLALLEWRGRADDHLCALLGPPPALADVCGRLSTAWSLAARPALVGELARQVVQDAPVVALTAPDPYGLVHRRVQGGGIL